MRSAELKAPVFKVPRSQLEEMVRIGIADGLQREAERYLQLAGQTALKSLHEMGDGNTRRALDHEIRAETFKAAAALAGGAL